MPRDSTCPFDRPVDGLGPYEYAVSSQPSRDPLGLCVDTLQSAQANVTMSYDGRGRRISKSITNAGVWDCTYHYYYDGDSLVETRNGSDIPIKHHVWGTRYIDELVQTSVLASEELRIESDVHYWACQDSNYNVLGVVDEEAVLVERYEYTPYGQRTVLFSPGANDVGLYAPTQTSRRIVAAGQALPHGICEVGHQGLIHDEEIGLVYNRARQLHPGMGRFVQRDPAGYVGSSNLFLQTQANPVRFLDPSGLAPVNIPFGCPCPEWNDSDATICARRHTSPANPDPTAPGFVACVCPGTIYARNIVCVDDTKIPNTDPDSLPILSGCIRWHEGVHTLQPSVCVDGYLGPFDEGNATADECAAYAEELMCLTMNRVQCGTNQTCYERIDEEMALIVAWMRAKACPQVN